MWPNSSECNQWPGHTNQIGTLIWLTTHETVITLPKSNLRYRGLYWSRKPKVNDRVSFKYASPCSMVIRSPLTNITTWFDVKTWFLIDLKLIDHLLRLYFLLFCIEINFYPTWNLNNWFALLGESYFFI